MPVKGLNEMLAKLKKFQQQFPDRVASALFVEGQIEMTESKRRCPVAPDGGTLRASGRVSEPEIEGDRITVTLSYGGAAEAYAIAVHEHLSIYSPYSWVIAEMSGDGVQWSVPGTGPKFLESVLNESRSSMLERIAKRVHVDAWKE